MQRVTLLEEFLQAGMHYPDLTQANALEKMLSRPAFPTSTPKNNKESKEK
jgi:hypothetical protein